MKIEYKHVVNLESSSTVMSTKNDALIRVVPYKGIIVVAASVNKGGCTIYHTNGAFYKYFIACRGVVWKSTDVDSWCVPFQGSDRSVISRTQRYLHDEKNQRAVSQKVIGKLGPLLE